MESEKIIRLGVFKKLKGYSNQLRQDYLLLKLGLTDSELILFRLLLEIFTDWDSRHTKYGTFTYDSREISYLTGWSYTKAMRLFYRLKKLGLIKELDRKRKIFEVLGYKNRISHIEKDLAYIDYLSNNLEYKHQKSSEHNINQGSTYLKNNKSLLWNLYIKLKQEIADLNREQGTKIVRKTYWESKSRFNLVSSKFDSSFNTGFSSKDEEEINSIVSDVHE